MPAPWVAPAKPFEGEPTALERAVFAYGFHAIGATGRRIAALGAKKRRYSCLVEADKREKQYGKQLTQGRQ
jgi:hypothetical protein